MNWGEAAAGLVGLALLIYLAYALLHPEKF
jgi:K+-transporting ATPase KdpF subunit